jgi:cytochrome oxidase Cu insertion factor (SCO1/SenC/PrrC family)
LNSPRRRRADPACGSGAYKVYYAKYPPGSAEYVIDHSSFIYLVDENGKYIGFFPPGRMADRVIEIIRMHLPDGSK